MQPMQTLGANQYQQQFQPIPQYAPPKSYDEIVKDVANASKKDSMIGQLVSSLSTQARYPLYIESLFWNKYSKLRKKAWGGCVTDMTFLINNVRMPIIRKLNYSETTWNVSLDSIPITIGNESTDNIYNKQIISLREYLSNFSSYISTPERVSNDDDDDSKSDLGEIRKISLLSSTDSRVIMNTQCCLLPINQTTGSTEFNLASLNWKTGLKNPSCLYIVSTMNGTSSVIIEGNFQKIYSNSNGKKGSFVISSDDLISDTNQCITIVQVPLKQKSRKQIEQEQAVNSSWGLTNWWSANTDQKKRVFDVLPTNCKDPKVQSLLKQYGYHQQCDAQDISSSDKPKISRSGIKVIPSLVPTYCCTRPLERCEAQSCYGEKNANITVSCDGCGGSYSGEDIIWHCPETINELHPNGYDLCDKCAQRQLIFDEFRGLKGLKRDERYQIRVTLLYYKPTTNGIINEQIINEIIQKLMKSESLGRVQPTQQQQPIQQQQQQQQPPPTYNPLQQQQQMQPMQPMQPIQAIQPIQQQQMQPIQAIQAQIMPQQPIKMKPTINIPKQKINPRDYKIINLALNELKLSGEYLKIFQSENVTDSDLKLLDDNDLNVLFASLGPRVRFRAWLKINNGKLIENKNVNQNDYRMINNIFRSLNVVNSQKYILNFIQNGITDKMVTNLNDNDLKILIPEMRVRILFRSYISSSSSSSKQQQSATISPHQQQQQTINSMQQQQTASATAATMGNQQFLF